MTIYALGDFEPQLPESGEFWIAPNASVIGNVIIERGVSIWFGATIRGDNEPIVIREGSNIQEHCVLHTDPGYPIEIGPGCTIGHKAMLHGCAVGESTLIGMNATVLNGARVGKHCLLGACALVTERTVIPDDSFALGVPAKVVGETGAEFRAVMREVGQRYEANWKRFQDSLQALS